MSSEVYQFQGMNVFSTAGNPVAQYTPLQGVFGQHAFVNPASGSISYLDAPVNVMTASNGGLYQVTITGPMGQTNGQQCKFSNLTGTGVLMTTATGNFQTSSSVTATGTLVIPTNSVINLLWNRPNNLWYSV